MNVLNTAYLLMSAKLKTAQHSETKKQSPTNFIFEDFEQFAALSGDALLIVDAQGSIIKYNDTFKRLSGYTIRDLKKLHFSALFDAQDKETLLKSMQGFFTAPSTKANKNTMECDVRMISKKGETLWMRWKQQLAGGLLYCSARGLEDIKQHEETLRRREKQLLEAESIGRMGNWTWTLGEDTIEWSDQIYRIFGVEKQNFAPTLESMNAMVHRADIMRVNQVFERAIIEENDYDMEFRIQRPDGETRFIRAEGRCSFDEESEVTALYGIMQDMTERVLYERNLKTAKEQAEEAYAARTQFLANMSHELRTPLNAIIGFSEMIERQLLGPIGNEKYLEYIGGIRESGEHLLDLISDILDMSKIEAGKYELDLEEINITKTIKVAAHMIEGRAHDSDIKVSVDPKINETLNIIADRRAILQICLNLLSNAVKFSKHGGQVDIQCLERDNYISLKVSDNGIGIPANKLASITRPFEQISSSYARDHEGSGLGLAITKELCEIHGGSLFIDSTLDVGTTVTVRLPYDAYKAQKKKSA